jgi:predicted Zn-dependent protease
MTSNREALFLKMSTDFPDSPLGHFSLGKLYLEEKKFELSVAALNSAVRVDKTYSAAWVALGDAYAGMGNRDEARSSWNCALETPHAQKDGSLRADLEQRMNALDEF